MVLPVWNLRIYILPCDKLKQKTASKSKVTRLSPWYIEAVTRKKHTLAQAFSCEFYEMFKNIFYTKHLWATASGYSGKV